MTHKHSSMTLIKQHNGFLWCWSFLLQVLFEWNIATHSAKHCNRQRALL